MKIYNYRARAYDPQTGRFLQTDPIGYADSMNLYEYVGSNPTNWVDPSGLLYELMHPGGKALPRVNDPIDPVTKKVAEAAGTMLMVPVVFKAQLDCIGGGVCEFLADPKGNIDALLNSLRDFSEVVIERNVQIYISVKESNRPWKTFASEEIRWGKDLWAPVGINVLEGYCDQIDRAAGDDFWESCKARAEITIVITELYYAGKGVLKAGKQVVNNADNIADDIVINTRGRACKVEVKQVGNAADEILDSATLKPKGVQTYEVGTVDALRDRSVIGDALDIHHTVQAHPFERIVPGYSRSTGPAIAVPETFHDAIPALRGTTTLTPRQILARDIWNLRNYTEAPNSSLQELIELNMNMYQGAFKK